MYVILYYVYVIIYMCVWCATCAKDAKGPFKVSRLEQVISKAFFPAPRSTQSFNRPCRPRVHVHRPSRTLARTFGSIYYYYIYIYTVVGHDQAPKRKCQFSPPRAGRMVVIAVEVPDFRHISCLPVLWPAYLIISADSKLHAKDYSNQTLSAMAWLLSVTTCVVLA